MRTKEARTLKRIWTGLLALCLALSTAAPACAAGAGGNSTIEIVTYEKQPTLTVQVVDKASGAGIPNVRVELLDPDHPDTPPITGSPLGVHETDGNGKIEIKLFSDGDKRYQIRVDHLGYDLYVGDIFTVLDDTYKLVELVKQTPDPGGDDSRYVYYYAGAGGSLDGVARELVSYNGSPRKVPDPIPDEDYTFAGWTLDGKFVEPGDLKVRRTIHLYAVFEFQPVPIPTPIPTETPTAPPVGPTPTAPLPTDTPATPTTTPWPQPSYRPRPVVPGTIGHDDTGGPSGGDMGGGPDDHGGDRPTDTDAPETKEPEPAPSAPAIGPGTVEPPAEDGHDHTQSNIHWWILPCAALTAALGLLRLWAIHRRVKELEREELEKEKERITK